MSAIINTPVSISEEIDSISFLTISDDGQEFKEDVNPTRFKGNAPLRWLVYSYIVFHAIMKAGIAVGIYWTTCRHCKTCLSMIYPDLASLISPWALFYTRCDPNKTIKNRFGLPGCRLLSWCLLAFFMDNFILFIVSYIGWKQNDPEMYGRVFLPCGILFVLNWIILYIVLHYDLRDYNPYPSEEKYTFRKRKETSNLDRKPLSILESTPFRMIIENCGADRWTSLNIRRVVAWEKIIKEIDDFRSKLHIVTFKLNLERPFKPGDVITLIPEGQKVPGAVVVQGHRCFGEARGTRIETRIYRGDSWRENEILVTMKESYKQEKVKLSILSNLGKNDRVTPGIDTAVRAFD